MVIEIQNLTINYFQEGHGQDALVLHGWGCNIQTVMPIINLIKNHYKTTAVDLPGFGDSSKPSEPYDSYDYANIIKQLIDNLGLKDIVLIGHSHGGRISIILSSQYPNLVDKLILIDSAGIVPKRSMKYYIKVHSFKAMKKLYLILNPGKDKSQSLERFYERHGSEDYRQSDGVMRQTMVKVINDDLGHLLRKIKAPTLLVWGENDDATPLSDGKIMEKEIRDSGLIVIKGAGHYSYIDDFQTFKLVISSFLNIN
ncbi:MAG TPA: alpha/beta hydrolase [Clostridiales bacterium]|nr:alpha/beta hydrolase [Clostridiales bacterium]